MYCKKCGRKNEKDSIFCIYCGKQMIEDDKVVYTEVKNNKNNSLALAGFIVGLISNVIGVLSVGCIVAIILSSIGLSQIKKNGESGRGFAIAGLILGIIGTIRFAFSIIFFLLSLF